ncbi:MAG: 16S rRNA (cytidine(1402)-2'-O)-methyltransferase, partial [Patescibacteria group bacterium]
FIFLGFLPKKPGHRLKLLKELQVSNKKLEATVIIYEAPHRLVKVLVDLNTVFGNINITLARELTKIYEEQVSSTIEVFLKKYEKKKPKGEFVILFSPKNL